MMAMAANLQIPTERQTGQLDLKTKNPQAAYTVKLSDKIAIQKPQDTSR